MSVSRSISQEVLYGRPERVKVFVSSKMRGDPLKQERETAVSAIEATSISEPWWWEGRAHAGQYCAEEICLGHADTCDVLVLILGRDLTPIVRREYERAGANHAQRCVYVKEGASLTPEAEAFVKQHRASGAVTRNFRNLSELRTLIVDDLSFYAVNSIRLQQLERRAASRTSRLIVFRIPGSRR